MNTDRIYGIHWTLAFGLPFVMLICAVLLLTGCVSGNKAEVSAIKIEKQSTASEVDQYITTAGKVFRFFGYKPDAKAER